MAERSDDGGGQQWFFLVEVLSTGLTSATVTPPGGSPLPMTVSAFGADYEDGPYATFALLQAVYPVAVAADTYTVLLNGSESVAVNWNPTEPLGSAGQASIVLSTPSVDAYTRTPDVNFTLDCTNCDDFGADIIDIATDGGDVSFGFEAFSQTPPATVPFASMVSENALTELPADSMLAEVSAGLANTSMVSLVPSAHMFEYLEASIVFDEEMFDVHAVDSVAIEAALDAQSPEWFLLLSVDGGGLTSATLTPPAASAIPLIDLDMNGESFEFESAPFASFAALQATYAPGTWTLTVDGTETSSLNWVPIEPIAMGGGLPTLTITSPADGAVGVGTTPDAGYALDCANCDAFALEMFDVATDGATAFFEVTVLTAPPFANPILFSSLNSENMATQLPDGDNQAELRMASADLTIETLIPGGGSFDYFEVGSVVDSVVFTVPEPAAFAGQGAALLALAALARRRRR